MLFSFDSINPKVVFTSAVVLFNHLLCYKRDKKDLFDLLKSGLKKINDLLLDSTLTDIEAVMGLLLCECRMLYQNKDLCEFVEKEFGE